MINLVVNLITGAVRRLLAPVRYIIRPSIEFAKKKPKTFLLILALTLGLTIALAASIFTGGIPLAAVGSVALTGSLGFKFAAVAALAAASWTSVLKGVSLVLDVWEAFTKVKSNNFDRQNRVAILNGHESYPVFSLYLENMLDKTQMDKLYGVKNTPMLIRSKNNELWVYGLKPKEGQTNLVKVKDPFNASINFVQEAHTIPTLCLENIPRRVYCDINYFSGHFVKRPAGNTTAQISREISCTLHAMDPEVFQMKAVQDQGWRHKTGLFFGLNWDDRAKPNPQAASTLSMPPIDFEP